jgi:hypothetical protein
MGAAGKADLASGDIQNGQPVTVEYDGTDLVMTTPVANIGFLGGTLTSTTAMSGAAFNEAFATIASATTTNIGAAAGNYLQVTGTTTITAFDTVQAGTERTLEFAGALTLTHNSTSLILPSGASIPTAAGDVAIFRSEGSGNWRCVDYTKANGQPLAGLPTTQQLVRAWGVFNSSQALAAGSSSVSIVKNATGDYTVTTGVTMSSANYAVSLTQDSLSAGPGSVGLLSLGVYARTTTTFKLAIFNSGGTPTDAGFSFAILGA